jgi:ABC-2 type transport system permease protein
MIGASLLKEIWLLVRDKGRLFSLFALPVAFIVVFGMMFKFGPDKGTPRSIAVWHAPGDARGELIDKALADSEGFAPVKEPSADAVRAAVAADDVSAGLVVPADFDPMHGKPVELVIDLAAPIQVRAPLQGALTGIVMRAFAPVPIDKLPPMVEAKSPPGIAKPIDNISGFQVTVPGNAVLFAFFISMVVAISFAHERHTGTWRRLLAAPVPRWQALLGKMIPYYAISLVQLAFLFGLGILLFGMRVAGSPLALVLLCMTVALCATSFGLLVASFGGTERQIGSTAPIAVLVMGLLGGCMFPRIAMPAAMKSIGHAVPHSWALDGYYDVLVREGTTVADIAPSLVALLAFAAGFALFGLWRFRFER